MHSLAYFVANFRLIRANRFDVSLIQNDAVRPTAEVKHTLMRGGYPVGDPQNETPRHASTGSIRSFVRPFRRRGLILDQNCERRDTGVLPLADGQ